MSAKPKQVISLGSGPDAPDAQRVMQLRDGVLEYLEQLDAGTALRALYAALGHVYLARQPAPDERALVRDMLADQAAHLASVLMSRRPPAEAARTGEALYQMNCWLDEGIEKVAADARTAGVLRIYGMLEQELGSDAAVAMSATSLGLSLLAMAYQVAIGAEPGADLTEGGGPDSMGMVTMMELLSRLAGPGEEERTH